MDYASWKRFVEDGHLVTDDVDEDLLDSWRRCREMRVDPSPRSCWDFAPMDQLEPFTTLLDRICGDTAPAVYTVIKGKGLLITITDANARVARTWGEVAVLRQADKLNFGPGANWQEGCVGTNAIGTAIATGRPMQIFGEEHYCRSHHPWSCTAAPIFDPTGKMWGCFDISGPLTADHSRCLDLVLGAARELEQRLARLYYSEMEARMSTLFASVFNSVMTGILSLDVAGRITSANDAAEALLGRPGRTIRGRMASEFFDFDVFLASARSASTVEPVVLRCLTNPRLYVRAVPVFGADGRWRDVVVTVSETQRARPAPVPQRIEAADGVPGTAPKGFEAILHASPAMRQVIRQAANAARTPSTVLLSGESGTGKELFARAIHKAGPRAKGPFMAVNCGSFSEELVQSELFGYCGGAFTGAERRGRIGKFESADRGVLFLDEISEMPLSQQVNLLRALEERAVVPVGGHEPRRVDVKVIAGTNKDLRQLMAQGKFREDLFYRLDVVGIPIPPLRERGDDVLLLARHHLGRICREFGVSCEGIAQEAAEILAAHDWPGNVRELVNCIEYVANTLPGGMLRAEHLPPYLREKFRSGVPACTDSGTDEFELKKREVGIIRKALDYHGGNVSKTAKALGIGRNTLYAKMHRFRIQP
ncbi:sigma-54-dependent Fis family transcriptional regulator [Desulfovibrio sp. X2]|uniref:sigma-54-dependent Fis family transcriptional regulator n=1 Tax=Desulfovibrio sp. X2 TaxID=941449 RepID=UPI001F00C2E0|nr:sigma 54-interacting transcriptional regulator [Desulfovibrio sp. X2]